VNIANDKSFIDRSLFDKDSWKFSMLKIVNAEEIAFTVKVFRLQDTSCRIDFYLHRGAEFVFINIIDQIREKCKEIDLDNQYYPDLSNILYGYTTNMGSIPYKVDYNELTYVLLGFERNQPVNYAKYIKDMCTDLTSLDEMNDDVKDQFKRVIQQMLKSKNDTINRYGMYCIRHKDVAKEILDIDTRSCINDIIEGTKKWSTYNIALQIHELF
jgi:hypothetical protein